MVQSLQSFSNMSLLRASANSLRNSVMPSMRSTVAVRGFADKPDPEFSEPFRRGTSSGFNKREQVCFGCHDLI